MEVKKGNANVIAVQCMDYRMGRLESKAIIRDSDPTRAVNVQLPGAMVNSRMGEETIRSVLANNPIEHIYVCPHTTSSDTCSGCGAGGFVYDVYTQKQNASQTMYGALVEDFKNNNIRFNTRHELEQINTNIQRSNIERIVASMGLKVRVESNLVDLAKYKVDMDKNEALLVLMYPSTRGLSSIPGINTEEKKVYAIRALPGDMIAGVQLASKMGITQCHMIAFTPEEHEALMLAREAMQKDDIAGSMRFMMRKVA